MDVEEKADEFSELIYVEDAPCQEVVLTGREVDVTALPVFRHFEGDAGRYITSGVVIAVIRRQDGAISAFIGCKSREGIASESLCTPGVTCGAISTPLSKKNGIWR